MRRRHLVIAGLVFVSSIALIHRLVRDRAAIAVETAAVTEGPIVREVLSTGTFQPARVVDVGAAVSGTLQSLGADFNTAVRQGQVIARIDPSLYQMQLVEAEAKLGQAQGELARRKVLVEDARVKLERAEKLAAQQLIPETELDAARVTLQQEAAERKGQIAALAAAQAEISQARIALERTVIRSPIDGVVISRNVEIGQTLASAFQSPVLFTIADLRKMHLFVEVNEADIGGVEPGAIVPFRVEAAGDQIYEGTITQVRLQPVSEAKPVATTGTSTRTSTPSSPANQPSPASAQASPPSPSSPSPQVPAASTPAVSAITPSNVVSYVAVIEVANRDGLLQPGRSAIVNLSTARRENVVRIPNAALAFRPAPAVADAVGQTLEEIEPQVAKDPARRSRSVVVWTFRNDRFEAVTIELGIADDTWTELVTGPIAPGDRLITTAAIRRPGA